EEKQVVVPGEVLAEGMDFLPSYGTYRLKNKIIAKRMGLAVVDKRIIKIIPLSGRYLPKVHDVIIGQVIDIAISGWRLEINSAYSAMLSMKDASSQYIRRGADLTKWFDIGDFVVAKITNVTSQNLVDLSMKGPGLRKLKGGRIIRVKCAKVPRIIGKGGSMIRLVKQATNCNITVGQNGWVWIQGTPEEEIKATMAIKKIDENSHVNGLTELISDFLGYHELEQHAHESSDSGYQHDRKFSDDSEVQQ
ncbi:exosome complex protein Rrp4, partial [Candidatus Woesearchaeota archaeon]|nr:exosome complex protein Rrp4 [Candidatus Woesearchaeota archaeon]